MTPLAEPPAGLRRALRRAAVACCGLDAALARGGGELDDEVVRFAEALQRALVLFREWGADTSAGLN